MLDSDLKKWLPKDRYDHSVRVEKTAVTLAEHFGVDIKKASTAALLHDCGRYAGGKELLAEAKKHGLKISKIELFQPKLVHARLGAVIAKKIFKVKDKDILSAISKHTVGSENMTMLEKIIYISDHIESGRRHEGVDKARKLAYSNIDSAIVESTGSMIIALAKKRLPICEQTVKTRNYYLGLDNA